MIRKPIRTSTRVILGVLCAGHLVVAYSFLSWQAHAENPNNTTVPNASQLIDGVTEIATPPRSRKDDSLNWEKWELKNDFLATGRRFLVGLAAGAALSLVVGVAMGSLTPVGAALGPTILFFGSIPPTAMLAVYYRLFGVEESLYIGLIALGVFPLLAGGLYKSVLTDVPDHAISKAYTLGASHAEVVWNVIVPQTLPRFLESLRLAAGLGMIFLIAAEWLLADVGFGHRLKLQNRIADMSQAYPYLFLLGLFGLAVDRALLEIRRRAAPWWTE
ncbi:MAG: ABC transporter permease subunit [Planctomycetota bacterium]